MRGLLASSSLLALHSLFCLFSCTSSQSGGVDVDPAVAAHYGEDYQAITVSNTSFGALQQHLLYGRPVVVTDGARGLPMSTWDCEFVQKSFPNSRMRHEGGASDRNDILMSSDWPHNAVQYELADQLPVGAPKLRPFYWDVAKAFESEAHRAWGQEPREAVERIVRSTGVPYFLPPQEADGGSSEFWFHPPGAGAQAHLDPHCYLTLSFSFSGARRWRFMIPPPEPHPDGYFDGEVYGAKNAERRGEWQPIFTLDAPAGSAVTVFPGMVHETVTVGPNCSASVSQIFRWPVPAGFYRAFWPRFARVPDDVGSCHSVVEALVTLGSGLRVPLVAKSKAAHAARHFARSVDADGDGIVSADEMRRVAASRRPSFAGRPPSGPSAREREPLVFSLEELVAFHDVDRDGAVTAAEVEASWLMFASATPPQQRAEL